jgi:hypothetical protein
MPAAPAAPAGLSLVMDDAKEFIRTELVSIFTTGVSTA